jgi:hypothetical protein
MVTLARFIGDWCLNVGVEPFKSVADLFSEQDDYLFEALLCSLDVYTRYFLIHVLLFTLHF